MITTENSTDAQGVKVYRVNEGYLSNIDEWNFHEITRSMGIDAAWHEVNISTTDCTVTASDYLCRECYVKFNPQSIHLEFDDTIFKDFDSNSAAFALAISYGIYEEVKP